MREPGKALSDLITEIRAGLLCERCGKYIGGLATKRYLPPPYPVALDRIPSDDEAETLIGFEYHMLGLLRQGRFVIRHPERDGQCISFREWAASDDDGDDGELDEASDDSSA